MLHIKFQGAEGSETTSAIKGYIGLSMPSSDVEHSSCGARLLDLRILELDRLYCIRQLLRYHALQRKEPRNNEKEPKRLPVWKISG